MVDFANFFGSLRDAGFYDVILPFLLIFVLVYGILEKTGIFSFQKKEATGTHKGINSVISLVVALIAVQFEGLSLFFGGLFSNLGIAIGAVFVFLLIVGWAMPVNQGGLKWGLFVIFLLVAGVVLYNSFSLFGLNYSSFWESTGENLGLILGIIFVIIVFVSALDLWPKKGPDPETILDNVLASKVKEK